MVDILPALKVPRQCPFVLLLKVGYGSESAGKFSILWLGSSSSSCSKSFPAVREAFSNAYPNKEVPNKTKTHRLIDQDREQLDLSDPTE
jgi:hypothetical protein